MLVRLAFGSRVGAVVDMLPHEAHAMLADGRASLPDAKAPPVDQPALARVDRGVPQHKRRAVR
jgi:hypothetical protein